MRVAKGADDEAAQRDAIAAASGATQEELDEAWVDRIARKPKPDEAPFPQRDYMIGAVREGDVVWVARPGIIGTGERDILAFLTAMAEHGAVLRAASNGTTYCGKDVASVLRLLRDIKDDERAMVLAKARRAKKPTRDSEFSAAAWNAAKIMWPDRQFTAEDVAAKVGISVRQLYRELGERGTPAFGRDPKPKGKKKAPRR